MTMIPTLTTERLMLRPPVFADYPAYERLMASPRSVYMGGPFDTRGAWGMFASDLAMWQLFGHGALMIDVTETGECVGQVGINHGPLFPEKELGWMIYEGFEGKGYALEAARALRAWAFEVRHLPTLVSYVDPHNARSIALAQRMGAVLDPDAQKQDPEDLVFRHPAP
ncbi:acetyltransferase [Devosia geojensis]|uniref:Acetyltransferase n=1 Tax=Devosia geojensis TaxID=443610 RepID=A0A0F5FP16_9HYPH|nr:GNAT family N-acetyltransferase [Devosia geojensis]KKB10576.1 acetyltransferase [Devosia geojensis]